MPQSYQTLGIRKRFLTPFPLSVREMIDAARRQAEPEIWQLFSRRLLRFTKTWAGLLTPDLDLAIRTVATECTIVPVERPEERDNRIARIEQIACATANVLKASLGTAARRSD